MALLTQTDLEIYIDSRELTQITDGNASVVPEAIEDAEEFVKEFLRHRINVVNEFAKTGTNRNRSLLKHCSAVAIYFINQRIPTDVLPEARGIAYEEALEWLRDIQKGLRQTTLEEINSTEKTGYNITWGDATKNNKNFY